MKEGSKIWNMDFVHPAERVFDPRWSE